MAPSGSKADRLRFPMAGVETMSRSEWSRVFDACHPSMGAADADRFGATSHIAPSRVARRSYLVGANP